MADMRVITQRVAALRRQYAERDIRHNTVYDVRSQKIDRIQPGSLPDAWPKPITANVLDTSARQLAENLAPLPAINCASSMVTSERAKRFTARRNRIAYSYVIESCLRKHMPQGCDWYLTYGSMPFVVEADFKEGRPRLRIEDPKGSYPQYDLWGGLVSYTKVWREECQSLAAKFPEHAEAIYGKSWDGRRVASDETLCEVVKYCDRDQYILYMPERSNLVLSETPNAFGKVPVAIADKPSYDNQQRGQFDDAIYPHLARNRMAMLALEATNQTVRAPLAIPMDTQKVSFGDNQIIRTNSPEKIRRVGQDIPQAAFQQEAMLADEVQKATRTPPAATGDVNASIITGQGVNALNGAYDIQIATGQIIIGYALQEALELCFEMDEKFWPDAKKSVSGVINGTPFEDSYVPRKDIAGNYRVSVSYGFMAGMNPSQALVFLLQLRGDQLVSRSFVQQQLPQDIDVTQMQAQVDIEQATDALKQGLFSMLASMGIMAQQGQDPVQLLRSAAQVISLREKGVAMDQAILQTFETPPAPPAPSSGGGGEPGTPGSEGGPGVPFGIQPATGLPQGTAPGQAQLGPGGRPDLQTLLAGLTSSGQPNLSASVQRRVPA